MSILSLGLGAGVAVSVYVIAVLSVGYAARRARRDSSLSEFYLAGRSLSGPVLLLTLYATQYSGNTLLGYPGEAYRLGFAWVMSIGFMMSIIVVYLLFAPRLHRLATRFNYITPGDWFAHRFQSPLLTNLANLLLIAAIASYLLAQLMAMGHITTALSGSAVPYWVGVVMFTLVIIVYETVVGCARWRGRTAFRDSCWSWASQGCCWWRSLPLKNLGPSHNGSPRANPRRWAFRPGRCVGSG